MPASYHRLSFCFRITQVDRNGGDKQKRTEKFQVPCPLFLQANQDKSDMPRFTRRDITRFTRSEIAPNGRSDMIFAFLTSNAQSAYHSPSGEYKRSTCFIGGNIFVATICLTYRILIVITELQYLHAFATFLLLKQHFRHPYENKMFFHLKNTSEFCQTQLDLPWVREDQWSKRILLFTRPKPIPPFCQACPNERRNNTRKVEACLGIPPRLFSSFSSYRISA